MKKNNKKGFFLSETMVVIAIVAVVLLGVFRLFNSVYFSFIEGENYNTVNAINALSNIQKYYESIENIDTTLITEDASYVDLTNYESYNSDYYERLKSEFKIDGVYLIDLNKLYSNDINGFNVTFRKYLNTLKNIQGIVLVVSLSDKEYAYIEIENYQTVTLIGDVNDEYAVYVPIGGEYTEPGYKNWEGEEPVVTWENDLEVDTTKPGTYYKYYDFNGYLLRRKIVVGNHTLAKYVDNLESLEESIEDVFENGLYNPIATYEGVEYDTGIRYYGANPNNYVYFNCEDVDSNSVAYGGMNYDYATSCEKWKIIGVFDVSDGTNTEKRVKIIRDPFTDNDGNKLQVSWDSSSKDGGISNNSGYGINQWGESVDYDGADLMKLLNTYYLGTTTDCKYCNSSNVETCSNDCSSIITPLSNVSTSMIENAVWELGAPSKSNTLLISTLYKNERSTITGKICSSNEYCNDSVVRTTKWTGKVGLLYPSDYGYASKDESCVSDVYGSDSTCKNDNWLHPSSSEIYWLISPLSDPEYSYFAFGIGKTSGLGVGNVTLNFSVRPTIYLSSNIEIVSGLGTQSSPYIIK